MHRIKQKNAKKKCTRRSYRNHLFWRLGRTLYPDHLLKPSFQSLAAAIIQICCTLRAMCIYFVVFISFQSGIHWSERFPLNNHPPPLSKVRPGEKKKCGPNSGCALDTSVPWTRGGYLPLGFQPHYIPQNGSTVLIP